MGKITLHVLDTMHGAPAAQVKFELFLKEEKESLVSVSSGLTNVDGRSSAPVFESEDIGPAKYRLEFDVASYFQRLGVDLPDPPFFETVIIDFGIPNGASHYHIPLLVSPYGYSTYRGS